MTEALPLRRVSKGVEEGDQLDVEYNLTHDQHDFVRPLSFLAHYLGYAWVGGNHSPYVGDDMIINRVGDQWIIEGNNNGSCSGYRCDEKTQIIVDNFAFNASDENFTHGEVNESDKELVKTVSVGAFPEQPPVVVVR